MLTGPRLAGLRVHRGEVVGTAEWDAILSRDEHERVRAALANPTLNRRGRPPTSLLAGVLRCGLCGGRMHMKAEYRGDRRRRQYVCSSGPGGGCGRVGIAAEGTETVVVEAVLTALEGPALVEAVARGRRAKTNGDDPAAEVTAVDARLGELADLFASGTIGKAEWVRARAGLDERREKALRRLHDSPLDAAAARARARGSGLRAEWPNLPVDEQREVIRAVVESIPIHPATRRGSRFDATRIGDPIWRA
jgi:hypothetical protein